jgi:DnaB-like helicase C terminal domain
VEPGANARNECELSNHLGEMRGRLRSASRCDRILTIIDYFQALRIAAVAPDAGASLDENRVRLSTLQSYQYASRTPKRPAGDPLLVISQVRKGDGNRHRLTLDDMLGSTELAYAADAVLLLEETKMAPSASRTALTLRIAKARDGGQRGDIALEFDHTRARITDAPKFTERRTPHRDCDIGRGMPADLYVDPLAGADEMND